HRLSGGHQGFHRRGPGRHRLAAGRDAGRAADRRDRGVLGRILLERVQGRRRLLDPGAGADLPANPTARQTGGREGVSSMGPRLPHMLKDAALTAFVAAALGFFIVGFRTYDASGKGLVFDYQFGDLAIAIVTIFVGRIGLSLAADGLRWPALVLGA